MNKATRYPIPARETRVEVPVSDSLFIATGSYAPTVESAEAFVSRIRQEFSDATHNCVAYRVGYGPSATERASDDGEPSGTAGRPMISVLQGQDLADIAVVVTRYFGGTKLGSGGLVRAYSGAVRALLAELPVTIQVQRIERSLVTDYGRYETIRRFLGEHEAEIEAEEFSSDVEIRFTLPLDRISQFDAALTELSHGQLTASNIERDN